MTSIAYRDGAIAKYTTTGATKTVVVPSTVQSGDLVLLFYSGATDPTGAPSGLTFTSIRNGRAGTSGTDGAHGFAWYRVATSGDAGSTITVPSASAKTVVGCVAYSLTSTTGPIDLSAISLETTDTASHAAASLVTSNTDWLVRALCLKDDAAASAAWAPPANTGTVRQQLSSGGTSAAVLVIADSNGDQTAGTYAGNWSVDSGATSTDSAVMIGIAIAGLSTTTTVRPIADITTSGWVSVPDQAGLFYPNLADDDPTSYIESPVGGGTYEVKLGALSAAPNSIVVKGYAAGGAVGQSLTTYLVEGTTVRATYGPETTLRTAEFTYTYTLDAPTKASLTGFNNLRVRQTASMS